MNDVVVVCALLSAALNLLAGAVGGWAYYAGRESTRFWILLRVAQGSAVVVALVVGGLVATGRDSRDGLFYLYALLPLAVAFVAEQLRVAAAQTVLDGQGLAGTDEVRRLPEARQRELVAAVLRREMGVMALAALAACFLELRAAGTAHF